VTAQTVVAFLAGLLWGWLVLWAARETAKGWRRALDRHEEERARARLKLRTGDLTGLAGKTRLGRR
jgi:hypothetical protein